MHVSEIPSGPNHKHDYLFPLIHIWITDHQHHTVVCLSAYDLFLDNNSNKKKKNLKIF